MEYSLQNLTKSANLDSLTMTNIVDKLNLIGFEIDDILREQNITNASIQDIRFLIKIPSNREDLLTEILFFQELKNIFLLKEYQTWERLKKNYAFLLEQKYRTSKNSKVSLISNNLPNIVIHQLQIENLQLVSSPLWLMEKLKNFGVKPTNTWNDILILVNLEWGYTINLHWKEKADNFLKNLFVESLKKETKWENQNGKQIILPAGTIVLLNEKQKILIALGVLSSFNTGKEKLQTETVVLETIFYDIHANSLNLNTINSTLSLRYLRKAFLENFKYAFQRLLTLLEIFSFSNISIIKSTILSQNIRLESARILGLKKKNFFLFFNKKEYHEEIFKNAGLEIVASTNKKLYFKIPSYRKDLQREIDLLEEYSRFLGYLTIKEIVPVKIENSYKTKKNSYEFLENFFLSLGCNQILNSSIQSSIKRTKKSIILKNPLNNDFFLLRHELISKLIDNFEINLRLGFLNNNSFEIGRVFRKGQKNLLIEEDRLAAIFLPFFEKNNNLFSIDWFVNKSLFESLFEQFGYKEISYQNLSFSNSSFHPTRSVIFKANKKVLGIFGEIHPKLKKELNLKCPIFLCELNLKEFPKWKLEKKISLSSDFSKYPFITKDLSFSVKKNTNFHNLKKSIESIVNSLRGFYYFDIYFDPAFKNQVNIGIRLEFQSLTGTLTNENVEKELVKITEFLKVFYQGKFKS